MLWSARLDRWVGRERDASWSAASRYGVAGSAARRLLRRALRPVIAREAQGQALVLRSLAERDVEARLRALSDDPPASADVVVAQTDVGTLLLHADDRVMTPFISEHGLWEPDEAAWLRGVLRPGDTFVDCGANVGYFSVLAAAAVGPAGAVVAVEPERRNLRLLRHNLWRNGCDNAWVVPAAAFDARGVLALRLNVHNAGDHQVYAAGGDGDVLVPCVALDDLLERLRVDVVKIDVQGSDHWALAGMHRTLLANPAASVLVEFWLDAMIERSISADDVLDGYRTLGRRVCLLGPGELRPASNTEIIDAARDSDGQWVNLVLESTALR